MASATSRRLAPAFRHHLKHPHRWLEALERLGQAPGNKVPLHQTRGGPTDDDSIGSGESLEAGGQVGGLSQGQMFLPGAAAHLAHHHEPGVNAHAHRQADAFVLDQARIQRAHGFQNAQPGAHGALGIVLMRLGIAKVHQQAIAQILRDMPIKAPETSAQVA